MTDVKRRVEANPLTLRRHWQSWTSSRDACRTTCLQDNIFASFPVPSPWFQLIVYVQLPYHASLCLELQHRKILVRSLYPSFCYNPNGHP